METVIELALFISELTILLGKLIDERIFLTFSKTVIFSQFLKDDALVLDFRVNERGDFFELIVN
jgi:hypothetical protein